MTVLENFMTPQTQCFLGFMKFQGGFITFLEAAGRPWGANVVRKAFYDVSRLQRWLDGWKSGWQVRWRCERRAGQNAEWMGTWLGGRVDRDCYADAGADESPTSCPESMRW